MLQIIVIVAPVFGLIGLGWLVVKTGYVSDGAGRVLAEFAFKIAMPVLLFRAMLSIGEMPGSPLMLVAAYFGAAAVVWLLAVIATTVVLRRPQRDAAGIAMGATFSNSVMLGIPLALSAFGPEAAAPAALLVSLDTPILWIAATLHVSLFANADDGTSPLRAVGRIVVDIIKNPIVAALIAGTVARIVGFEPPDLLDKFLELIAQAAVPTALAALGMSLATYKMSGQAPSLGVICLLKIVAFPILTYVACVHVFDLPPLFSAIAILFAAMPVGANAYLFAERYQSAPRSVSTSIAISTAIALVTVSALLFVLTRTFPA